ncbi:karyopherin Kap95 [Mitosporidium daphniae]
MNISLLLQNTLSPDQALRESATVTLERASVENFGVYIQLLAAELANADAQQHLRVAAGVALKNSLSSKKDPIKRNQQAQRWTALDATLKTSIKSVIINTMASANISNTVGTTLAQVLASIAGIELPRNEWPELIPLLLQNVTNVGSPNTLRRTTLEAIGFMCEDIEHWVLAPWSSQILTAVIQGARKEELDSAVRLAAITSLNNSLLFVATHFENETERNFLMTVVCEATQSLCESIAVAAFECLVSIMTLYYQHMASYMTHGLFIATIEAMKVTRTAIALQAIEFWSTVCESEIDRLIERDSDPSTPVFYFAKAAAPLVLPTLLELLVKSKEEQDADEGGEGDNGEDWTVSKAAATSLSLFAGCVQDELLSIGNGAVFSFIERNIAKADDWAAREAALMAFGSILDGPPPAYTRQYAQGAMPTFYSLVLNDTSLAVRESAAWYISRVCELLCNSAIGSNEQASGFHRNDAIINSFLDINSLVTTLESLLSAHPRVAFHAATGFMHLGAVIAEDSASGFPPTNILSPFLPKCFMSLFNSSMRADVDDQNLRSVFFQAMSALIDSAAIDCETMVLQLTESILGQLEYALSLVGNAINFDDLIRIADAQSNYCLLLQSAFNRLREASSSISDRAMAVFLSLLNSPVCCKNTSLHEDVLMVIDALFAAVDKEKSSSYFTYFYPKIMEVIGGKGFAVNPQESTLISVAAGIIGEFFRSLPKDVVSNYSLEVISSLLEVIKDESFNRNVKITAISSIGDIIDSMGTAILPSLSAIQMMLVEGESVASTLPRYSLDDLDYISELREKLLHTWTFIIHMAMESNNLELLNSIAPNVISLVHSVSQDDDSSEAAIRASIGTLGDMGQVLLRNQLTTPWMRSFIRDHLKRGANAESTITIATWAYKQLFNDQ